MILWVIGAGGLFGSAVVRTAHSRGDIVLESVAVPWKDASAAEAHLRKDALRMMEVVCSSDHRWAVMWAAGSATTATSPEACEIELKNFQRWIEAIGESLECKRRGAFFLTSSAGGVYAASAGAPFDAQSEALPIGEYGRLKLRQEMIVREIFGASMKTIIGRVANLYGPGQDTRKLQGLVSRLCLASVTREPLSMFVPLDTLRDFIYVDDAASAALHWIDRAEPGVRVRVIASGSPCSLGYVLATTRSVVRHPIPIVHGFHSSSYAQADDLRLMPDTDETTRTIAVTPLPVGVQRVYLDLLGRRR